MVPARPGSPLRRVRHHAHVQGEGDPRRTRQIRRLRGPGDLRRTAPRPRTPQRGVGRAVRVHPPAGREDEARRGTPHGRPPLVVRTRPQNERHHGPGPHTEPPHDRVARADGDLRVSGGTTPRRRGGVGGRRRRASPGRRSGCGRRRTGRRPCRTASLRRPARRTTALRRVTPRQDDHHGDHPSPGPGPPPHPSTSRPTRRTTSMPRGGRLIPSPGHKRPRARPEVVLELSCHPAEEPSLRGADCEGTSGLCL